MVPSVDGPAVLSTDLRFRPCPSVSVRLLRRVQPHPRNDCIHGSVKAWDPQLVVSKSLPVTSVPVGTTRTPSSNPVGVGIIRPAAHDPSTLCGVLLGQAWVGAASWSAAPEQVLEPEVWLLSCCLRSIPRGVRGGALITDQM